MSGHEYAVRRVERCFISDPRDDTEWSDYDLRARQQPGFLANELEAMGCYDDETPPAWETGWPTMEGEL